jgi:hypothetical protein
VGEASDAELQDALFESAPSGADSNIHAAVPSDAGLDQAWQGDLYGGLSTSIGPDDLYTLSPELGYTTASSGVPVDYGFLPQQGVDLGKPLTDSYDVRVTGEHRRVGALEGFFTFNGVGQALSGLWDSVTSLPDLASNYIDAVHAAYDDTNEIFRYLLGEADSVDFKSPIAGRIQDDGSVLPILGDTVRGAVLASPLGLIDAGYREDWYSFGQRLPSLLEAPLLARGLGKASLDGPDSAVLSSSRTGKTTGNIQFDRLFSESPQAQKMIAGLEKRNVSIVDDVTMLKPGESAYVSKIDGRLTLVYDSKSTSFLDMLHESRHVAQVQRTESAGVLGNKNIFDPNSTRLRGAGERGAYEYELRLGNRFNFSDEYMNYAKQQIDFYYPKSYSSKFTNSPTMNAIFKAMEPGLKP